jgi:hypothetical protein
MLDVHAPEHAAHSWRDFLIHIATICVGLLIAIAIEQCVEALHHHHQREDLEHQMYVESVQNLDLVRAQILFARQRRNYLYACIRALQAATPSNGKLLVTLPVNDVFFPAASQGLLISPSRGTWTIAQAAGTVALLPPEKAKVYARLDLTADFEKQAEIVTSDTAPILASARLQDHAAVPDGHPLLLTQPQVDDLLHAFGAAREAASNFHFRLVVLKGALDAVVANVDSLQQMYPYQTHAIALEGAQANASRDHDLSNSTPQY